MKANELSCKDLMIGDWVIFHDSGYASDNTIWKEDRICQIDSVDGDVRVKWAEEDGSKEDWPHISTTELSPIPLTPEILEKNGFIKDANKDDRLVDIYHLFVPTGFERESFTIQVGLYREPICGVSTLVKCWGQLPPYNGGMNDIHLCNANYVHQLQHALRLCGIEKEIIL